MAAEIKKLSKYEMARILGARAMQLSLGAPLMIELSEEELEAINYDVYAVAKIELERNKLPMSVEIRERKSNVTEEILKQEAELVKLERELKIQDVEDKAKGKKEDADSDDDSD